MSSLANQAAVQATKAGIAYDSAVLAATIAAGLPAAAEFVSPEGHSLRIDSANVHMLRDGEIVKTVPLAVIGADRMLVSYAISIARISIRMGD